MEVELLEIIPRELRFTFELKKQSSCLVQLVNISEQYVAYKVKTTSPKKYSVRPNTGIIHPKSTCDFTVTMQAQRVAPPDMQCKDKFLIQGIVVPAGTAVEAITPETFAKDSGKYIEENKLKVILVSPPESPILGPINGVFKEDYEESTIRDQLWSEFENLPSLNKVRSKEHVKPSNDAEELKPAKDTIHLKQTNNVDFEDMEMLKPAKDMVDKNQAKDVGKLAKDIVDLKQTKDGEVTFSEDIEKLTPAKGMVDLKQEKDLDSKLAEDVEELKPAKVEAEYNNTNDEELKPAKVEAEYNNTNNEELQPAKVEAEYNNTNNEELKLAKDVGLKASKEQEESKTTKSAEVLELAKDVEELKFKVRELEAKLNGAETTITKLREERSTTNVERETLQQQLAMVRRQNGARRDQVGFPFLFVFVVALVSIAVGRLLGKQR